MLCPALAPVLPFKVSCKWDGGATLGWSGEVTRIAHRNYNIISFTLSACSSVSQTSSSQILRREEDFERATSMKNKQTE